MKSAKCLAKVHGPKSLELCFVIGLAFFTPRAVLAAEYYVAPMGSDSNAGSMAQPFATLQKGHDVAMPGDTVWVRGGVYNIVGRGATTGAGIALSKSGTSDTNRIKFWAYAGEVPIFDFSQMTLSTSGYTHGFVVTGSWLHLKGFEIRNVRMNTRSNNGIAASRGGNNIFELLNLHHLAGTGIFIGESTGGNLILNCDAHDNYDPTSTQGDGQNADGFGVHYQTSGPSTIIRGSRAWWNSDDGYDLISQEVPVIIENSYAFGNGFTNSGMGRPADGNGNGFKVGSSKTAKRHIVRNCLAWGNRAAGFYANHSSGGNDWFNNTAYMNGTQYNMLASPPTDSGQTIILTGALAHKMRNNIGFPNRNTNMGGVDSMFNSWDLNIMPAAGDFVSVSDMGALGPRLPDGSLPNVDFMKLRAGSPMIDKGTNVDLPFAGAAPDLGAFETGLPPAGTGGSGGTATGGMAGANGISGAAGSSGTIAGSGGATGLAGSTGVGGSGGGAIGTGGSTAPTAGTAGAGGGMPGTSGGVGAIAGSAGAGAPIDGAPDDAGCACSTPRRGNAAFGAALAGLLLAAFGLRRRRPASFAERTPRR